jgi:hypothetical protein
LIMMSWISPLLGLLQAFLKSSKSPPFPYIVF